MISFAYIQKTWKQLTFWGGVAGVITWKILVPGGKMLIDIHDRVQSDAAFKIRVVNYIESDSLIKVQTVDSVRALSGRIYQNIQLTNVALKGFSTHLSREKMFEDLIQLQREEIDALKSVTVAKPETKIRIEKMK